MKIAICEAQSIDKIQLESMIHTWAQQHGIDVYIRTFPKAEAFLFVWEEIAFDLIFIHMPGDSALELANWIWNKDPEIMLTFIFDGVQCALEKQRIQLEQYLIQPVSLQDLTVVLNRAFLCYMQNVQNSILVSDGGARIKLNVSNIQYISMSSHNANIKTPHKTYILRKTIGGLMDILPSHFSICHRSYIVNILKVAYLHKDRLALFDGTELPVSRKHAPNVFKLFKKMGIDIAI